MKADRLTKKQIDLVKIALKDLHSTSYDDGNHSTCIDIDELKALFDQEDADVIILPKTGDVDD